ncbi:MAG: hypothetical protein JXR96_19515 [Deltaproteobacteria bacterium]|nr:hypothetical protein [Deltaproteobacteria bacterium]
MSEIRDLEEAFLDAGPPSEEDPMGVEQRIHRRQSRRYLRHLVTTVAFFLFGIVLSWLLREELVYFFQSGSPQDLGAAEQMQLQPLRHNAYLQVTGVARDMCIRSKSWFHRARYLYLLGSEMGARLLIESPSRADEACLGAVERTFDGRLSDLSRTRRYDLVLLYYREHFQTAPLDGPFYLLEHGVRPVDLWYYPGALGLLFAMAVLHLLLLLRHWRRAREGHSGGAT